MRRAGDHRRRPCHRQCDLRCSRGSTARPANSSSGGASGSRIQNLTMSIRRPSWRRLAGAAQLAVVDRLCANAGSARNWDWTCSPTLSARCFPPSLRCCLASSLAGTMTRAKGRRPRNGPDAERDGKRRSVRLCDDGQRGGEPRHHRSAASGDAASLDVNERQTTNLCAWR